METIKYSKLYQQDIARGRGSGEVTLGDGAVVSMDEVNLDSFDKLLSELDATSNSSTIVLTVRHITTGTPANGLGTKVLFQGQSADEDQSDLAALESAFDDVTAGSEDSSFYILLRRAGAALSRALKWTVNGNFLLTHSATLTADRTWTWPDSSSTVVGADVSQTLTNKTLTDSIHNAGSGSENFRPNGIISVNTDASATAANTTETDLLTFSLPASSLSANGRGVRIRAWGTTATNANTKTVRLYFGNSVLVSNNTTTAPNGSSFSLQCDVYRTAAVTQDAIGNAQVGNTLQSVAFTLPTEDTSGAITIKITGQNGTAAASDIIAQGMIVEYLNA
jgi:hypothetical protein